MNSKKFEIGPKLAQINFPIDLREKFEVQDLPQICQELRQYIIDVVSEIGNSHFGASMGVVELTVALHFVYNTPIDILIWDVGHQAYGHKILTGRKALFPTNREKGGLSGFPKMSESDYDAFGTGHSSTSISAALGMSVANEYLATDKKNFVAVIGDGALTGGMAFEGINHAGSLNNELTVVLNDNCMSIDPNVGALKNYLSKISASDPDENTKDKIWEYLAEHSNFGNSENAIKEGVSKNLKVSAFKQSHLFESLNFQYFGPFDGHDVERLTKVFNEVKSVAGPKIVHVLTRKGAGYKYSEEGNPTVWHAPGTFNKSTGQITKSSNENKPIKYQKVFGYTIIELAEKNHKIMGITPAMPTGSSLDMMMAQMPNRAFDVGIAEQHAVTFSAGLASQGIRPYCNIYSSFIQRAYDQIVHDVALQKLPVIFCLDRAGIVGADGPTHHGAFDLAFMRSIPNMVVSAPMNESELRNLMFTAQYYTEGPISIRYPRGRGVQDEWQTPFEHIPIGRSRTLSQGNQVAVLTIGHIGNRVQDIVNKEGLNKAVTHVDMRFVKPLDTEILKEIALHFDELITIEDGCLQGGFGSAVTEYFSDHRFKINVTRLGIPDQFIEHGTTEELHEECGLDSETILETILQKIKPQ